MNGQFYQTEIVGDKKPEIDVVVGFVPTLFIGVGGSGKDVLMRLRKRFDVEYAQPRPEFARSLILDTDMQNNTPSGESAEAYVRVQPGPSEYVDCQISEDRFRGVFDGVRYNTDARFQKWLKPSMEQYGPESVQNGAGTHRQFGRMAFFLNYLDIRKRIEDHVAAALEYAAQPHNDVLVPGGTVVPDRIEVVLVASLAGGTGSGMLIDTAYLVKDILSQPRFNFVQNKFTSLIVFLPTLFREKANQLYKRFQQNAYATLLELEYYGTPRTGDDLFLGELATTANRVGFKPEWASNCEFIPGAGWEACYLVDNANPPTMAAPIDAGEAFQMVADYLFMDFQGSPLATAKRSARSNLVQFRDRRKETKIWRLPDAQQQASSGLRKGEHVLFATHNGCTFSSLGLAEISFDKARVYRAAGYRLAAQLVRKRWLGVAEAARVKQSDYDTWTTADLFQPRSQPGEPIPPSFMPEKLLWELYQTDRGNWLAALETDFQELGESPPPKPSEELWRLANKHVGLLHRGANGERGDALKTLEERCEELSGKPRQLGAYRARLRELSRQRADSRGVCVTLRVLEMYRQGLTDIANAVVQWQETTANPGQVMLRPEEAEGLTWLVRGPAVEIEFPRARRQLKQQLEGLYRAQAAAYVQKLAGGFSRYIGGPNQQATPDLAFIGTLHDQYAGAKNFLEALSGRLDLRFSQSCEESKSERKQELLPKWDAADYDRRIDEALLANAAIEKSSVPDGVFVFDVAKFERALLEQLHRTNADYKDTRTFSDLIDHWFRNREIAEEGISRVAEQLGTACAGLLDGGLNLIDFANGVVIDILYNDKSYSTAERETKLRKLITRAAPYLPYNARLEREGTNFKAEFRNILGRQAGDSRDFSVRNQEQLDENITELGEGMRGGIDGKLNDKKEGGKYTVVLCREVCGVPLQYYAYLDEFHEAYHSRIHGSDRSVDECHINYHEAWEDLPDIRTISHEICAEIRDNVDEVLFAIMTGVITCDDGVFHVSVPDKYLGSDKVRLGTRINRIIKHSCEKEAVRKYLQTRHDSWSQKATPKHWAAVYASALQTYEDSRSVIKAGAAAVESPPLRNCYEMLLGAITQQLDGTEEGRRWHQHLRGPKDESAEDYPEQRRVHQELYAKLRGADGLLKRVSERIPIYRVEERNLGKLTLPPVAAD